MKNAFLVSLSHGPLALVLPIVWLLPLPAVILTFKRLCRVPTLGSLLVRISPLAIEVVLIGCLHIGCAREIKWQARCEQNLRKICFAFSAYFQDWDEHFLPERKWMDAAKMHLSPEELSQVFTCPSAYSPFGYAFNSTLGSLPLIQLSAPAETVMSFECDAMKPNTHGGLRNLPQIPRRLGGDIYGFFRRSHPMEKADFCKFLEMEAIEIRSSV
ncbi:MAG: hypothetical protein ACK40X_02410 [Armatimonadota bacterium]